MNVSAVFRAPHRLVRRNLTGLERLISAAGLAGLIYLLLLAHPVFPPFWDLVIVSAVFAGTLYAPAVGYFLALAAGTFSIFSISLYLSVIYLAIGLLGQQVFIRNLGALVLILATPLLAGYHLAWLAPLLGGLFWGASSGFWIGMIAALWGLSAAGMAGLPADWFALSGHQLELDAVVMRFEGLNSLETLAELAVPLASNSTVLLFSLLQLGLWGAVAAFVGKFTDRISNSAEPAQSAPRAQNLLAARWGRPWAAIILVLLASGLLYAGQYALTWWLGTALVVKPAQALMMGFLTAGVLAAALEALRDFFESPFPIPLSRNPIQRRPSSQPEPKTSDRVELPKSYPDFEQPDEGSDDLIMLELD
jgi:hypothetical protein